MFEFENYIPEDPYFESILDPSLDVAEEDLESIVEILLALVGI